MITITDTNFVPFNKIPKPDDPKKVPNVVIYPELFSGKIAEIMERKLAELHYNTTKYCMANKLTTCPRKMLWFADNPDWTFVFSRYHMFGLEATPFPAFVRCIQYGVQKITGQTFNACLVNVYEGGQDHIGWHADDNKWLGDDFMVPSVSFGAVRRFQLRSKEDHAKKFVIPIASRNKSNNVRSDTYAVLRYV